MFRGGITCGLEEQGADGDVVSLRVALQRVEKGGMVDFSLGGHTCARPAAVAQGHQDDHFQVAPDAAQALLWRPHAIATRLATLRAAFCGLLWWSLHLCWFLGITCFTNNFNVFNFTVLLNLVS